MSLKDLEMLHDLLLTCPETGEEMDIKDIETNEDEGEFVVYVAGPSKSWRHIIRSEEF